MERGKKRGGGMRDRKRETDREEEGGRAGITYREGGKLLCATTRGYYTTVTGEGHFVVSTTAMFHNLSYTFECYTVLGLLFY